MKTRNLRKLESRVLTLLFFVLSFFIGLAKTGLADTGWRDMETPGGVPVDIEGNAVNFFNYIAFNLLIFVAFPLFLAGLYYLKVRRNITLAARLKKLTLFFLGCSILLYMTIFLINIFGIDDIHVILWTLVPLFISLSVLFYFFSSVLGVKEINSKKKLFLKKWSKGFFMFISALVIFLIFLVIVMYHGL